MAELEKEMFAARLVLSGVDPAFATLKQQLADFRTEYAAHSHQLPFDYVSFKFLLDEGKENDRDFLMAYVWEGTDKSLSDFQRTQDAEKKGDATFLPKQTAT